MLKELSSASIANEYPVCRTFVSTERHKKLDANMLADLWGIGLKRAKMTLEATTQMGTCSAILPLSQRYRADNIYGLKVLRGKFDTDSLFPEKKLLNGHVCSQIYSHKCGFAACYPIDSPDGDSIGYTLRDFCHDFGKPEHLTFDGHMAQKGSNTFFMKTIKKYHIDYHLSSPRRPNEQPAEGCIRVVKTRWYRIMMKRSVPLRFWDYGLIWICETGNISVSSSCYAKGRTPLEIVTGETPDISEYTDFGFYDWVTWPIAT